MGKADLPRYTRRTGMILTGLWLVCAGLIPAAAAGLPDSEVVPEYVNRATWAETMVATRSRFLEWYRQQPVRQEAWYYSNPLADDMSDRLLLDRIDVEATDADGTGRWIRLPRAQDDHRYRMSGKGSMVFYLCN